LATAKSIIAFAGRVCVIPDQLLEGRTWELFAALVEVVNGISGSDLGRLVVAITAMLLNKGSVGEVSGIDAAGVFVIATGIVAALQQRQLNGCSRWPVLDFAGP
jgi:hypothetical protein